VSWSQLSGCIKILLACEIHFVLDVYSTHQLKRSQFTPSQLVKPETPIRISLVIFRVEQTSSPGSATVAL
jgi:hypothetical protein